MAKAKMVSGVLARDNRKNGEECVVVFFPGVKREEISSAVGFWDTSNDNACDGLREWTPEEWREEYDLPLPRKGRAFEVEIEL